MTKSDERRELHWLEDLNDSKHPDIDWRGAQIMRRHLVHRYWGIEDEKVWQGVEYLPKIKEKVESIIEQRFREREQTRRDD